MSNDRIRRAFEARVATWAAGHGLPVAYENVRFDPPAGNYVRCNLLPNNTQSEDLAGEHRKYFGFFQVSLVLQAMTGPAIAEALSNELDALFPLASPIVVDGLQVNVTSPMSAASPTPEPDRYFVPVSCAYRADTAGVLMVIGGGGIDFGDSLNSQYIPLVMI